MLRRALHRGVTVIMLHYLPYYLASPAQMSVAMATTSENGYSHQCHRGDRCQWLSYSSRDTTRQWAEPGRPHGEICCARRRLLPRHACMTPAAWMSRSCIVQKRLNTQLQLLWYANRKPYPSFRMIPFSMILSDIS